jgi:hypothetical protein
MFAQWHDRLYGNFGGAELDYDSPNSTELVQGSFFLSHFEEGNPLEWEASAMDHFLVYDGTAGGRCREEGRTVKSDSLGLHRDS